MTVCVQSGINEQACYPEDPTQAKVTVFTSGPGSIPPNEIWVTLENANGPPMNPNIPNSFPLATFQPDPAIRIAVEDGVVQAIIDHYVSLIPPPIP